MPTRDHYVALAKKIKGELDEKGLTFKSYRRVSLTNRLRKLSGEPNTRIKKAGIGKDMETVFGEQGLRIFPKLSETTTGDVVRIWGTGSVAAELLDLILNPSPRSDKKLGDIIKPKGEWVWTPEAD